MKKRTWILIADGARARMLLNEGPGTGLKPATDAEFEADHLAPRVLDAAAARHEYDAPVLVAPPRTLGEPRASLDKGARAKVSAELGKDLVNLPVHDLPSRLAEILRL